MQVLEWISYHWWFNLCKLLKQWWYQWKKTSRVIEDSTETDITVQDRTCRSLHVSHYWLLGELRWANLDKAFKCEKPRWKSDLFSLQATGNCASFSMFWLYLGGPYEEKQIMSNRGTQGPFYWLRKRANGFSVLSPMKRDLPDSKRKKKITGINTRQKIIINKKDKQTNKYPNFKRLLWVTE